MTTNTLQERIAAVAAEAARGAPGVAFLRPGVADLLRTRIADRAPLRGPVSGAGPGTPGVRVSRDEATGRWHIDIRLVLRRGHRALDVTRAVRSTVLAGIPGDLEASVRVTVMGVV
ncbi:Asp23/Gls24 family envelope stress response protein [Streptomyces sp. NPDC049916]|uniref:Asp23/Gls24 family envelope stress response protein n=1 Tax=Streptomyces sp. NPDC049916 TaxID=3155156 RepID=UPI00341E0675